MADDKVRASSSSSSLLTLNLPKGLQEKQRLGCVRCRQPLRKTVPEKNRGGLRAKGEGTQRERAKPERQTEGKKKEKKTDNEGSTET